MLSNFDIVLYYYAHLGKRMMNVMRPENSTGCPNISSCPQESPGQEMGLWPPGVSIPEDDCAFQDTTASLLLGGIGIGMDESDRRVKGSSRSSSSSVRGSSSVELIGDWIGSY